MMKISRYSVPLWLLLLSVAAVSKAAVELQPSPVIDAAGIAEALPALLAKEQLGGEKLLQHERVVKFYREHNGQPAWLGREGGLKDARALLSVLDNAPSEGLPAAGYHRSTLQHLLQELPASSGELAQLDILLTDAFLDYSLDVRRGRINPAEVDSSWHIVPSDADVGRMLLYALESHTVLASLHSMPPYERGYRRLRAALHDYRAIATAGGWPQLPPGDKLQRGSYGQRVALLRQRLLSTGDLPAEANGDERDFDTFLELAVRRFQARMGLVVDGVVGDGTRAELNVPVEQRIAQIELNMERWRWLPRQLENNYLLVNMTGFQLDVMENDRPVMQMRVIIGSDYKQTPVFGSTITQLVVNPSWYVPRSIFYKEILPHLRSDGSYLMRHNMTVLGDMGDGGRVIDPEQIDWGQYEQGDFPYVLRREPGEGNPLGKVKFVLPNHYGIYLHDTSEPHLFAARDRTFSHGCIRLEKPLVLAAYLLDHEPGLVSEALKGYLASGHTVALKLPNPWPIYLVYWTAWVDEQGALQFRDDVYARDRRLLAALSQQQQSIVSQNTVTE